MIVFGTCVGYPEKFRELCVPGIESSMMGETYVHLASQSNGHSIFPVYQEILSKAALLPNVEALVLLHDDLELKDASLAAKIRNVFRATPDTAVLGCIGARDVTSLRWWEGRQLRGYVVDAGFGVHDHGFPEGDPTHVDTLDGMLLVLSPWAIQSLRLPEEYVGFHGYSDELCFQAKRLGKSVQVTRLDVFHHSRGGYTGGVESFEKADQVFRKRYLLPLAQTGSGDR